MFDTQCDNECKRVLETWVTCLTSYFGTENVPYVSWFPSTITHASPWPKELYEIFSIQTISALTPKALEDYLMYVRVIPIFTNKYSVHMRSSSLCSFIHVCIHLLCYDMICLNFCIQSLCVAPCIQSPFSLWTPTCFVFKNSKTEPRLYQF